MLRYKMENGERIQNGFYKIGANTGPRISGNHPEDIHYSHQDGSGRVGCHPFTFKITFSFSRL